MKSRGIGARLQPNENKTVQEEKRGKLLNAQLRIVVAEDHPQVLQRLIALLLTEFRVVAVAEKGQAALECVRQHQPDVAVLDLEMPILNGIQTAKELRKMPSPPVIVICSADSDPAIVECARQAGATGYVLKTHMYQDLVKAVKFATRGEFFIRS